MLSLRTLRNPAIFALQLQHEDNIEHHPYGWQSEIKHILQISDSEMLEFCFCSKVSELELCKVLAGMALCLVQLKPLCLGQWFLTGGHASPGVFQ